MERMNEFFEKAEVDRQRVKAGIDEVRKQKKELQTARDARCKNGQRGLDLSISLMLGGPLCT